MGYIKITVLDALASKVIRLRAKNQCQRCLKYREFKSLQAAHCFGRANKRVRYDLDNMLALDYYCHQLIDSDPEQKRNLFTKYLGQKGYDDLNKRANWPTMQKVDFTVLKMYLKKELENYEPRN